ncbi:phage tail tube protein [Acetobacter persici]|uniref:phage tail tube protein n=1 Tax=Acetobacter persici TaxID=1076596 RepID=UPI0039EB8164
MAFTGATAGIAAGAQTNDTVLDWALEATYKTPPTGNYQQGRFTAETLSRQETTARPLEINTVKEVSQSVVTQIAASGRISGALSTGTYDDFLAGVLGSDWSAVSATSSGGTDGVYIQCFGESNTADGKAELIVIGGANITSEIPKSGFLILNSTTDNISDLYLPYFITSDKKRLGVPNGSFSMLNKDVVLASGATITFANIQNGGTDKTYTIRKKILGKYLMYPGSVINQMQFTFAQGQFAQIEVDVLPANELLSDTDIAASVLLAPSGNVHNTVDNFLGVSIFGVTPAGCVTNASITLARSGSKVDYGNGHADGCSAELGQFQATGSLSLYFRTWDQYQAALAGTQGPVIIKSVDNTGNGYAFVFINAALRNPQLQTDSVNKTYELKLDIEGNPAAYGETFAIFRLAPGS